MLLLMLLEKHLVITEIAPACLQAGKEVALLVFRFVLLKETLVTTEIASACLHAGKEVAS